MYRFSAKQSGTEVEVAVINFLWRWLLTGPLDGDSHGLCGHDVTKVTTVVWTDDNHQIDVEKADGNENGEVYVLRTWAEVGFMVDDDDDYVDDWHDNNNNGEDDPWQQPVSVPLVDGQEDEDGKDEPQNDEHEGC